MASVLRLEIEYGPSQAAILSSEIVDTAPLSADAAPDDDSDGVWVSVSDAGGDAAFHYVLPQPNRPREIFAEDGSIAKTSGTTGATRVSVDVPWIGEDGSLTIHSGRGGAAMGGREGAVTILNLSLGEVRDVGPSPDAFGLEPGLPTTLLNFGLSHAKAIRLVFLPDGFTAGELPLFHRVVDEFLATLGQTAPFPNLVDALCALRVDLISPSSGVIDPQAPGNGARPLFNAKMGSGELRRLIEVNQSRARQMAKRAVDGHPHFVGLVVANTAEYGGSGGDVAVFSRHAGAAQIAIHELGHSLFKLADEYSEAGQSSTDKPIEANVASKPDPHVAAWAPNESLRLKWSSLLTNGVVFPTPAAFGNATTVGAYEGAKYKASGLFRPSPICKMRNIGDPFCRVCQKQIEMRLRPHLP